MPKTEEELKLLKEKVAALESELKELSEDELEKVTGGIADFAVNDRNVIENGNTIHRAAFESKDLVLEDYKRKSPKPGK